jgi:hypothetical protein
MTLTQSYGAFSTFDCKIMAHCKILELSNKFSFQSFQQTYLNALTYLNPKTLNMQTWTPKGQINLIWVDGWFHMNLVTNYIWSSITFIQFLNRQIWTSKGQINVIWVVGWFHVNLISNYIWSSITFIQFLNIQIWTPKGQINLLWVVG